MTSIDKKRLKQEGKELASQRSIAWAKALHLANPAKEGSDEWMQNHLRARRNESWLRDRQPDHITAADVASRFILISSEETGSIDPFAECLSCHDILYSAPKQPVSCTCGTMTIAYSKPIRVTAKGGVRGVRLIGKGTE